MRLIDKSANIHLSTHHGLSSNPPSIRPPAFSCHSNRDSVLQSYHDEEPYPPRSLIYPAPLLQPPKTKWDFLPSSYPITADEASRAGVESYHIKQQSQIFSSEPFVLNERSLHYLCEHQLQKKDAHRFCWKDCAVYITVDLEDDYGSTGVGVERVFIYLYRTSFRDGKTHLDVGHFFGRAVQWWDNGDGGGEPKTIKELMEAHRLICERVREKMADADADSDEVFEWDRRHGEFAMKRSFERCFVVVDQAVWWERGVLLVRSEKAKRVDGVEEIGEWSVFSEGDEGWAARMGMDEAVKMVRKKEDDGEA